MNHPVRRQHHLRIRADSTPDEAHAAVEEYAARHGELVQVVPAPDQPADGTVAVIATISEPAARAATTARVLWAATALILATALLVAAIVDVYLLVGALILTGLLFLAYQHDKGER